MSTLTPTPTPDAGSDRERDDHDPETERDALARAMASQVCRGMRKHDQRDKQAAIDAFAFVDRNQFAHLSGRQADRAAEAYVQALWEKDRLERQCTQAGELDTDALADIDWSPVADAFADRAELAGIHPRYATKSTEGWKRHKVGGNYAEPMGAAQLYELRAALQNPDYPEKPHQGRSGYGPEVARYLLAVELHDMHTETHWEQALETMTAYYERILRGHEAMSAGDCVAEDTGH